MSTQDEERRGPGRRPRTHAAAAAVGALVVLAACGGENLFTAPSFGADAGGGATTVDITEPTAGQELPLGDSVTVTAKIVALSGLQAVTFSAFYDAGILNQAFGTNAQGFLNGPTDTTITRRLPATGTATGSVTIFVDVLDGEDELASDSVVVTIVP